VPEPSLADFAHRDFGFSPALEKRQQPDFKPQRLTRSSGNERFLSMRKITSTALVALLTALVTPSVYAQGQSSGEDTQRRNDQSQQQLSNSQAGPSQSSQAGQYSGSAARTSQGTNSSSYSTQSSRAGQSSSGAGQSSQYGSSSQTSSQSPQSSQSNSSTSNSSGAPASSTAGSSQSQPSSPATSSQDTFKSDTSATGRLSTQPSSQGSPASGESSTSTSATATGRPGDIQSGANVQVNQQHVTQFQNVFTNWRPGASQEQQLTAAINASAPGARINHEYITRFVTDYNAIVPRVHLSTTAQQRLATAFATVLTPNVQVTTLEPTLTEVRQVLVESGLSPIQAQTVACDLHLMAAQVHPDMLQVQVTK
jgi:hypothetical protein